MGDIIDFSAAGFTRTFDRVGVRGYVSINMEMFRDAHGLKGTGRYCIYCLDPGYGSAYFIIEEGRNGKWISKNAPAFVKPEFISWIVDQINERNF
jgi:hypothetical protein